MADVYVAKRTYATQLDGARVVVRKGVTRVRAGHPLIARNPDCFEPVDASSVHYDVQQATRSYDDAEQATSAPGEKRGGRRRKD